MNIVEPILHQCRINAEQPAICAPGTPFDVITYAQLEYMINNVIRKLLPFGFEQGQIVGLLLQDAIFHVVVMLALMRMGIVTISCSSESLSEEIGATAMIIDSSQAVAGVKRVIHANPEWVRDGAGTTLDPRPFRATGEEVCRIFLTSGTTGVPKAVGLSHRMLMGRNVQFDYAFGGHWPEQPRLYCDLGVASEPAFRFILYMLVRGGMVMFYGKDHVRTIQSLDLFKVRSMVTSPRGLADHLNFYERTRIRCCLDHILALGGGVATELLRRVWARMSENVFSDYGATEVGSIASADLRTISDTPGATGYVVPPALVETVDESGTLSAANREGLVRLRTPYMATGYLGQPQASADIFRDGWFYPGDYGYVTPDDLLVITGRLETRLNIGGSKVNPERVEDVLTSFPGVTDAAVITVPGAFGIEEIYALVQTSHSFEETALRTHCEARLARSFVPVRFIAIDRIPRNEIGKIERAKLPGLAKQELG